MRTLIVTLVALIGGFLAGIALSELVGITGFLLFDHAFGLRFLPIYLAVVCAGAALILDLLGRRRAS